MIFPSKEEILNKCWNQCKCDSKLEKKRCDIEVKYLDFQIYLDDKWFCINYYRQIKDHEKAIEFHPQAGENIRFMIYNCKESIKNRLESINKFKQKYNLI